MTSRLWLLGLLGCASAEDPLRHVVDAPPGGGGPDAPGEAFPDAPAATPCEAALASKALDFEANNGSFAHAIMDGSSGDWPLDDWAYGTPTVGPGSCHGGTKCWGTKLTANYSTCQRASLTSPSIDLSLCAGSTVKLQFWSWHDFWESGTFHDGGIVEISTNGTSWQAVTPSPAYGGNVAIDRTIGVYECFAPTTFYVSGKPGFIGNGGGWKQITVTLPATALTSTFRVRFAYATSASYAADDPDVCRDHTRPGWYLDDVTFTSL